MTTRRRSAVALAIILSFFLNQIQKCASNGSPGTKETCGPDGFYCRSNAKCVSRSLRCPSTKGTGWSWCSKQDCQPAYPPIGVTASLLGRRPPKTPSATFVQNKFDGDRFHILTAFSPIYRTGSRSRRRRAGVVEDVWKTLINDPWMHSFVQFKGFVYEFGTYGVQELDINDPNYKYNREWSTGWSRVGTSQCQHRHLRLFLREWQIKHGTYSWYSNNCHSFTKALVKYLKDDCRNLKNAMPG